MQESTIKKNSFYGCNGMIEKNGLGYIILDIDKKYIQGIWQKLDSQDNFKMPIVEFEFLIRTNLIEFVEILPDFVIIDYKKVYEKNLTS